MAENSKTIEESQKNNLGLFDSDLGGFKEPKLWRKTRSNN